MQDTTNNIQISISNLADILDIHQRTLRIWDSEGILSPERSKGNTRFYSITDIDKGHFIQFLTRNLGLNLAGVKIVIGLMKNKTDAKDYKNFLKIIKKVAIEVNIDDKIQSINVKKNLKRGRRKKMGRKAYKDKLLS